MNNLKDQTKISVDLGRPAMLALLQKGWVDAADVARLRRDIFCDRSMSRIEVEDLFGLDAIVRPDLEAWVEFFVEAVTDHLVWDQRPTGVLEESQARWLIEKVDASKTGASFAVLVNILDDAHRVPGWFENAVKARALAEWPGLMTSVNGSAPAHSA